MSLLLIQSGVFILGLCLGSFLNVVIYRLPKTDLSVSSPRRSLCPSCQAGISWYDNLPVISYVVLRGKCRACGHDISIRYPLVELTTGLLTLAVFFKSGFSIQALAELYLVLSLIAATFIDLDEMIIPDAITFPGMVIGLAAAAISPNPALIGPWLGGMLMEWGGPEFSLAFHHRLGLGAGAGLASDLGDHCRLRPADRKGRHGRRGYDPVGHDRRLSGLAGHLSDHIHVIHHRFDRLLRDGGGPEIL